MLWPKEYFWSACDDYVSSFVISSLSAHPRASDSKVPKSIQLSPNEKTEKAHRPHLPEAWQQWLLSCLPDVALGFSLDFYTTSPWDGASDSEKTLPSIFYPTVFSISSSLDSTAIASALTQMGQTVDEVQGTHVSCSCSYNKESQAGVLIHNKYLFLTVLEPGSPRPGCLCGWVMGIF